MATEEPATVGEGDGRVVVAVDSPDCPAALDAAVGEARLRGCGVHVVHVVPPGYTAPDLEDHMVVLDARLREEGRQVLDAATAQVQRLSGGAVPVSERLLRGAVVTCLVQASAEAVLLVLQHRGMGEEGATSVTSIVGSVAARAHVPVTVVPSLWTPTTPEQHGRTVVVGVADGTASDQVVHEAAEAAVRRRARLRLVHAVHRSDHECRRVLGADGGSEGEEELSARIRSSYDAVLGPSGAEVEVVVGLGSPAELLLDRSGDADLLVVGRHHSRLRWPAALGSVPRTVLRWSPVPVLVVDPDESNVRSVRVFGPCR